jgi:hypothetical protein
MTPFLAVLRVVNVEPQVQVTWVSTYSGWMPDFMLTPSVGVRVRGGGEPGQARVRHRLIDGRID